MESGELSGTNVALIAATVSGASAIIGSLVSTVFAHLSASKREIRARNAERLSSLIGDFLRELKNFGELFSEWATWHKAYSDSRLQHRQIMDSATDPARIPEFHLTKDEINPTIDLLRQSYSNLTVHYFQLEIYAPYGVQDAYERISLALLRAFTIATEDETNASLDIDDASSELVAARKQIIEAVKRELYVKTRREKLRRRPPA